MLVDPLTVVGRNATVLEITFLLFSGEGWGRSVRGLRHAYQSYGRLILKGGENEKTRRRNHKTTVARTPTGH